jgi:NADH-quinone oxidoreductase subunit L
VSAAGTAVAVALPVLPGAAGLVGLLLRPAARRAAAALGIAATGLALAGAVVLVALTTGGHTVDGSTTVAHLGGIDVTAGVRVDAVAAAVAVAVGVVACLVQVYSVGYLAGDRRYGPYAAQVSLFSAAMLDVVVASDLVQLLVGWEVMGICSYLLIAHDRALPEAPAAAVKAFVVTRIGDIGFWLGVVLLGTGAGSFRIADLAAATAAGQLSPARLTTAAVLLLAGVAGKSAQFPLHTWLPDAMAGPTPVSALIHAATMVAAGVYVVTRLYPVFLAAPAALAVLGVLASVTMLLGGLAATAQDDIKRVLAWSTVSQIGYMAGGLAVGSSDAAIFHLLTHAAFKALLFLAAGAVIHAVGSNSMSRMGGLRRAMPVTFWTMTIGLAALAGVPPFAGFWSKESLLGAAWTAATEGTATPRWAAVLVLCAALATVAITAWYVTRLWLRTFFGARREQADLHEPGWVMRAPLVLLAIPAALLGLLALWSFGSGSHDTGWFAYAPLPDHLVDQGGTAQGTLPTYTATATLVATSDGAVGLDWVTVVIGMVLLAAGLLAGWLVWRRDTAADPARVLGRAGPLFAAGFRLDDVQDTLLVRPTRALARAVRRTDERVVDGAVEGTGTGAGLLGGLLGRWHNGLPRYVTAILAGAVLLGVAAVLLGGAR